MEERPKRQLKIVSIFVGALVLVFAAVYFLFQKDPTCSDGIKNQGEAGIDCGGPCHPCAAKPVLRDIEVVSAEWVYDSSNKYDAAIRIKNSNSLYGAESFRYKINFKDANGSSIKSTEWLDGFVLPGEQKYLFSLGAEMATMPEAVTVQIEEVVWKQFTDYEEPNLFIKSFQYKELSGGSAFFSEATGSVFNNSQFDFDEIIVKVILRDAEDKLLAINYHTMGDIMAKEERAFTINFPRSFAAPVLKAEKEVEVNVFTSKAYININGTPLTVD